MATNNGTKKDTYSGRPAFYLRLYVWRSSLDIAGNRSKYSWWLRAYNPDRNKLTYRLDNDPYAVNVEGSTWSGGHDLDFRGGQSYIQIASGTTGWKSHSSSGELTVNYSASHGPAGVFGSASLSGSFSSDTIPIPPTNVQVQRLSDGQHKITWTRESEYEKVGVNRRTDGGPWQRVATPVGNLWTFTETTTSAGHQYEYAIRGIAAAGQSAMSNSVTVRTTPAAPSTPVAVRTSGDDIRVSTTVGGYGTHVDLQDDGSTVVTGLPKGSLPWDHLAPNPTLTHKYRARASCSSGGVGSTTLYSAWSGYSNIIELLSPPNAPVSLAPNGGTAPSDADVVLSWVHNPVDSSPQSAFEVRHRPTGGAWTTISGTTAETVPVTLGVGGFEWEVRTKGEHPDWSPWSATAVVEVIDRPGVDITQPDTIWDASILPVQWTFFQAQAHPQSSWELELLTGGDVVESRSGDSDTTTVTLTTRLGEGDHQLRVRAAAGDVWSDWTSVTFEVSFDPPAPPTIAGQWDESEGGVQLTVGPSADPLFPATVDVTVERDNGAGWESVGVFTEQDTFFDRQSISYGDIVYRAVASTVEGATAITTIVVEARSLAIWLSSGPGFGDTCRLPMNPDISRAPGRGRALKHYAGSEEPTAYSSERLTRVWQVGGRVTDRTFIEECATPDELVELIENPEALFLLRTPDGHRRYGAPKDPRLHRENAGTYDPGEFRPWNAFWGFTFQFTEAKKEGA